MKRQPRQSSEFDHDKLATEVGGSHCLRPVVNQQSSLREGAMSITHGHISADRSFPTASTYRAFNSCASLDMLTE